MKWIYNGQWQKDSDIVLLFYIAMHDPTIYFNLPAHIVHSTHINAVFTYARIETYAVSKNNRQGISWRYTEYKLNAYYY